MAAPITKYQRLPTQEAVFVSAGCRRARIGYSVAMLKRTLALLALAAVAACSRVSEENFAKIRDGMSEQQVIELLGKPAESSSVNVLGLSGTASKWVESGAVITVQFVNGKVRAKSFDRPAAKSGAR